MNEAREVLQQLSRIVNSLERLSKKLSDRISLDEMAAATQYDLADVRDSAASHSSASQWLFVRDVWLRRLEKVRDALLQLPEHQDVPDAVSNASRRRNKPNAPSDLLSLRDYATVQAAVEIVVCWGFYPCFNVGVNVPIQKRLTPKTLKGENQS